MNSVMERWAGSCRRELLDRTLIWNVRHLMMVLREYGDSCNSCRPHRALDQAAPLRALPDGITDPLVSGGLAAVDVSDFAGDLSIHSDPSAGVLDGQ